MANIKRLQVNPQLAGQLANVRQQLQRGQFPNLSQTRQLPAPTRGPSKSAPGGASCDCPSRRTESQLRQLFREELAHALGDVDGGVIYPGNRDQYTPYKRVGGETGKGGVVISDAMTVATDATAGDVFTTTFTGIDADRMAGERLCSLQAIVPDELVDVTERMMVQITLSGDSLPYANRIPLDYLARTATGEIQRVPISDRDGNKGYLVPQRGVVGISLEVVADLGGAAGNADILFRAETGESCR